MNLRHRVAAEHLELGLPLPWDVFDCHNQLLLCKGFVIERESQLQVLLARGLYVDIRLLSAGPRSAQPSAYNPFRTWDYILDELEFLLRNLRIEQDFSGQMQRLAALVQTLAERNPDTALAAMILTDQRRYPIIHSLHTAILCELIARRMEWDSTRRVPLCCAAMCMNLAMLDLQAQLCTQRGAPTAAQRREILRHPELGEAMLREAGVQDEVWLAAVRDHHERTGGGGYPFGVANPGEEARLIQTCDIFSAKVSPRAARPPATAQEAARSLFIESAAGEKNPFAVALIKEIGIYPPGTLVTLANGDRGIVHSRGETATTPVVLSLVRRNSQPYARAVRRDTRQKEFEVRSVLPRDALRIDIDREALWSLPGPRAATPAVA